MFQIHTKSQTDFPHEAKPLLSHGPLFYTEMAPLLPGMKIIWIKLKLYLSELKTTNVCLLVFIGWFLLNMAFQIVLRVRVKGREDRFFFNFISQVWKDWGISNFPTWMMTSGLGTCVKLYQNCSAFSQLFYTVPLDSNYLHTQVTSAPVKL